jgi:small subunit ribosomal protein S1
MLPAGKPHTMLPAGKPTGSPRRETPQEAPRRGLLAISDPGGVPRLYPPDILRSPMSKLTEAQKRYIEKLNPGQRATGVVKSFQEFGAFVSIGLVSGLLHNKNIRWGRVEHPEHHLRLGQKIEVIILEVDKIKHRVSFGYKQLHIDPWEKFAEKYKVGDHVAASVLFKKPFGLIMEIVPGIEALLHKSELPEAASNNEPLTFYEVDEAYEVKITEMDLNEKKLKVTLNS